MFGCLYNKQVAKKVLHIILLLVLLAYIARAQEVQQKLPDKTRILFLLDGSGSMLAGWGRTNRITAAKELLGSLVDSLKTNPNLELALRAYGHLYRRSSQNCKDTRLEVGFGKGNHNLIINKLNAISPKGTTPIAYSLEQTANDFPLVAGCRNIVIIITDGIESCDGDPCEVSLALQKKGIFLKPFIIGIGMGQDYRKQFKCIGEYYDAKDISSFQRALSKAVSTSLDKTTASIELLDINRQPRETNVNVSFINNFTKEPAFDFVHYRDIQGRPDSVQLDPVLTYDVVVNTLPPVIKRNVNLTPGKHNIITISSPQGKLAIKQKSASTYTNSVRAIIKENGKPTTVNVHDINSLHTYLVGKYDIEVLTTPRRHFRNVEVNQDQTTTLTLPEPGLLNLYNSAPGYGSIYEIDESGRQKWVYDLAHNQSKVSLALQPGTYKIVFRVDKAPGSKYTATKMVTIQPGRSAVVKVFN
ncbi:VWA domain-containing protein [Fulvivirga sp. 29W222]|uniref:VWA domain-containing protein n=1 Tax=Fulvivirga marina TaxID=2494733 RepID=A0A937FT14_9BACT|nr:VWA domain-containing protein [Fulvivirga marina]MBL6444824.1 VWA domain-containing protein [Fulvivirga marina]